MDEFGFESIEVPAMAEFGFESFEVPVLTSTKVLPWQVNSWSSMAKRLENSKGLPHMVHSTPRSEVCLQPGLG